MRKIYAAALGATFALCVDAATAQTHTFIATGGNDANLCTRTSPCRTLQRGHNRAGAGATLTLLDSGEYVIVGNVTISKSITISATGISAIVRSTGGGVIRIDNPAAQVVLRGILLTGAANDAIGIDVLAATALHIENCQIERFTTAGLRVRPVDHTHTELFVTDSVFRDSRRGVLYQGGFGETQKLTVDNSRFENNSDNGLEIFGVESTITRTIASGNGGHGIAQTGGTANIAWTTAANNGGHGIAQTGGTASITWTTATGNSKAGYLLDGANSGQMTLESSVARGNAIGLFVSGPRTARISSSVFTNNDVGIENEGVVLTRRNNIVSGNTQDLVGKELTPLDGV